MRRIKIITDSTCDLPEKLVNENEIEVMSLIVNVGGKEYLDRSELNGEMLFEKMKETDQFPTTSQITPNRFYEKFKKAIDEDQDVLCITLSSKMSGTNQSANIAKGMMEGFEDRIVVIDSLNVTVGMGLLVLKACKLREEGKSLKDIESTIMETIPKVKSSLYFNSLESLIKGGRISKAAGAIGTVLGIKPILCVEKGEMKVRKKLEVLKKL